jgi:pimeloyl-ACP methyl ester carboxylesterase
VDTEFGQNYTEIEGNGYPLFLLHQVVLSSFEFQNVMPLFSDEYCVFAPDMPGFGRSDPAPLDWKLEDFARNVVEIMDALNMEKAHIAGHHTGAIVASEIAAAYPDRVNRLILSGCAIYDRNEAWKAKVTRFSDAILKECRYLPFPFEPPYDIEQDGSHLMKVWNLQKKQNSESELAFVQKAFITHLLHADKRGGSAILAQMEYDRNPRLPLIKAPTLCLSGRKDIIGPPIFKPPDTAATLIPGATHLWLDGGVGVVYEEPHQWAQPILEFLEE